MHLIPPFQVSRQMKTKHFTDEEDHLFEAWNDVETQRTILLALGVYQVHISNGRGLESHVANGAVEGTDGVGVSWYNLSLAEGADLRWLSRVADTGVEAVAKGSEVQSTMFTIFLLNTREEVGWMAGCKRGGVWEEEDQGTGSGVVDVEVEEGGDIWGDGHVGLGTVGGVGVLCGDWDDEVWRGVGTAGDVGWA